MLAQILHISIELVLFILINELAAVHAIMHSLQNGIQVAILEDLVFKHMFCTFLHDAILALQLDMHAFILSSIKTLACFSSSVAIEFDCGVNANIVKMTIDENTRIDFIRNF
jgi:hypothetical protein